MKNWKRHAPLALLLLALVIVAVVRLRLLAVPLERDEGEFAYGGQLLRQGIPPYELLYNMKFPGIYAGYALLMTLFGQTDSGIHFGLLLVNGAAIWLVYCLARHFLNAAGAATAAASYALLSASPVVLGLTAHATHFVVAAALGGLLLLLRGEDSGKPGWFFGSGLLLGLACLMKQPGALFGLFGFCALLARGARDRTHWRIHVRRVLFYLTGWSAPLILTGFILWQAGVFKRFWFWTIVYARAHAAELPWSAGWYNLTDTARKLPLTADGLFWFAAVVGLVSLALLKGDWRKKFWLAGLLLFSGAAVSLSNYFSEHYFVMLLPALCLLAGQAVCAFPPRGRMAAGAALILIWLLTLFHHRETFFVLSPEQASKKMFYANPFVECRQIGRYLRENSAPDARVAVLGSEPEILFYARRHSATGYIYMYDLIAGPQPYAGEMQDEIIKEIEAAQPEYLVFVRIPISWDFRVDFQRVTGTAVMNWLPQFAGQFYEPAGFISFQPESEYYWGRDALQHMSANQLFISIFRRK